MPLIKGTIPSLIGGVSQQDSSVRLPSQIEAALNCDLSPALGACKRPPATFVNQLGWDIPANAFFHSIERDAQERYIVVIYDGRVRVFNHVSGKEHIVVMHEQSRQYLRTQFAPHVSMRAVTVEDYTFIVNREVVVKMSNDVVPTPPTGGININDPGFGFLPKFTFVVPSGGIVGSVQTFQDLPKNGVGGGVYEIRGATNDAFTRTYVSRESAGVWAEVAKPGIKSSFDFETMPHGLKRIPDGTTPDGFYFSYGPLQYDMRYAGDEYSCPPPSFVGQRIGNAVYHHDRLGFLAGENVILSEVGHYMNFWRTTVTSLLDSDPIDVAGPSEGVAQFTHALSYQSALLLYASGTKSMFQLTGDPVLTPKTVKIAPVTNYQCSPFIAPVVAGSSVFFLNDTQGRPWSTLREYFVQSDIITPDAADVSAHVPHYIPGDTRCMASAQDANLILLAHRNPTGPQVYVHQFKWSGDTKQQSAWHPWQITTMGAVLHMHAIGTDLYVVAVAPGGGAELMKMDLSNCPVAAVVSSTEDILLDRREVVTPVYQAFGNYTDITVPYVMPTLEGLQVLQTVDRENPGAFIDTRKAALVNGGQTLRMPGNLGTGRVMVGYRYTQSLELSQQYLRDQNERAQLAGRLQLRRMTVRFQDTAYFKVKVLTKARPGAVDTLVAGLQSTYSARTAGDSAFLLGTPASVDGTHAFLVPSRADRARVIFENDSPFQARFQSVQWEALYTTQVRM